MELSQQQYLDRLENMLSLTGGAYTAVTLRNYLAQLETTFGDNFDPQRALDDLIKSAELLKSELAK